MTATAGSVIYSISSGSTIELNTVTVKCNTTFEITDGNDILYLDYDN